MQKIFLSVVLALLCGSALYAKPLALYDEPQSTSQVAASADTDAGVIPIYSPPQSEWMKVADPRNGNVGWVKQSELQNVVTTIIKYFSGGSNANSLESINANLKPITPQEMAAQMNNLPKSQDDVLRQYQSMLKDFYKSLQDMKLHDINPFKNFPLLLPMVIMPVKDYHPTPMANPPSQNLQNDKK